MEHNGPSERNLTVRVAPRRLLHLLLVAAVVVALVSVVSELVFVAFRDRPNLRLVLPSFFAGMEANVPTWYASSLLLVTGGAIGLVALAARRLGEPFARHWAVLSVIFIYMSMDEASKLHEKLNIVGKQILELFGIRAMGLLRYPWVVPAIVIVMIFAVAYLRFFLALSMRFKALFATAAVLYLGGALGVEALAARFLHGPSAGGPMLRIALMNTEELLEVLGVTVLCYAALCRLRGMIDAVEMRWRPPQPSSDGGHREYVALDRPASKQPASARSADDLA